MKKTSAATVVSLILLAFSDGRLYAILLFLFGWMSFYNKDFDFAQIENIIASIFCIVPIRLLVAMILAIVGWKKSKTGVAKAVLGYSIAQVVLCCVMVAACFGWFYLIPWLIAPYGTY